ncbi:MAG: phage holin family protein [Chitinophagales bacterium]
MRFLISILLNGLAVFLASKLMDGVSVAGYGEAIIVGIVLGLINTFIKPIITLFTLPITILTLGLFLLVINGAMVLFTDSLIDGFSVSGLGVAIVFSILLAILNYILGMFVK